MRKVEQIEQQIRELSSAEFAELRDWVLEQDWAAWDARIEADSRAGKLDKLIAEAKADFDAVGLAKFEALCLASLLGVVQRTTGGSAGARRQELRIS